MRYCKKSKNKSKTDLKMVDPSEILPNSQWHVRDWFDIGRALFDALLHLMVLCCGLLSSYP